MTPFEATAWFAIMAPAGTPAEIVQKINTVTNRYLQSANGQGPDRTNRRSKRAAARQPTPRPSSSASSKGGSR